MLTLILKMKIKIAIITNKNFYEKSLPLLIDSLKKAAIDCNDIHVFNAGFDRCAHCVTADGINYWELDHNSFEYSALLHISEHKIESDYWFLIHDTCTVGPKFKELLYNIPESMPEKIALRVWPSMSIGAYRYDYLIRPVIKNKLLEIKNTDYSHESMMHFKNWGTVNEDYILWKTEPVPMVYNNCYQSDWHVVDYNNWYGTDTIRRTEYYKSLDLYKNKANWGQATGNHMTIKV